MSHIIEIDNLCKSYGKIKAVDDISFHVKKGELFAFLGVNGAGKSTTISVMCGNLRADSGSVKLCGSEISENSRDIKSKIGVVFQNSLLDKALTVADNLESRAALYGIIGEEYKTRLVELSKMLNLGEILNRPLGKLSGGQRRRADIARALIHNPEILILDEPTTGLDPQTRSMIWKLITDLRTDRGLTVFLTTHYMEEAADADYVVIIDSGKIAASGTPLELKNEFTGDYINVYNSSEEAICGLGYQYSKVGSFFRVVVPDTSAAAALITDFPDVFKDFEVIKGRMDDVFLAVTGKKLSGGNANENS